MISPNSPRNRQRDLGDDAGRDVSAGGQESGEAPVALAMERVAALRAALAMVTVLSGGLTHESDSLALAHARSGAKHKAFRHVGLFFLVALLFRARP
jgi:hypothetical protein